MDKVNISRSYSILLGQVSFTYEKPIKIITRDNNEIIISPNIIIKLSKYFDMCFRYNETAILDYDYSVVQKMIQILHNINIDNMEISEQEFHELLRLGDYIDSAYLAIFLFYKYFMLNIEQKIDDLLFFSKYFSKFEIDLQFHEELWLKFFDLTDSNIDYLIKLAITDSKFSKYLKFDNDKQYFDIIDFFNYKQHLVMHPGERLYWNYLSTYSGMNNIYGLDYLNTKTRHIGEIFTRIDTETFKILLNTLEHFETYFSNQIYAFIIRNLNHYNKHLLKYLKKPSNNFVDTFCIENKFIDFFENETHVKPLLFSLEELKEIYQKIHG